MSPRTNARGFYAGRLAAVASEPNFSGVGPTLRQPGAKAMCVAGACLAAMLLGLAFGGDTPVLAIVLVAAGAALVAAACLFADSE